MTCYKQHIVVKHEEMTYVPARYYGSKRVVTKRYDSFESIKEYIETCASNWFLNIRSPYKRPSGICTMSILTKDKNWEMWLEAALSFPGAVYVATETKHTGEYHTCYYVCIPCPG
jgi:hypothetical protein